MPASPYNIENLIRRFDCVQEYVVVGALAGENDAENSTVAMKEMGETCAKNLKDYECLKMLNETDKKPHEENDGKQNYLLLEIMG